MIGTSSQSGTLFCWRCLFLKHLCDQARRGWTKKSFQRCDGKENERATVFFPLRSPLGKCKKRTEPSLLDSKLQCPPPSPPKKRKGYKCSGGVKNESSDLVWLGENGSGGGGEWGEGRKHHQVAPWMRWIRVSSHLLKLCGPWFCPRTSWGGGGGGRAKLGMGRCERWGEGGCWGRGEQWLNSDRAFLISEGGLGGCWAMGSFPVAYWCHFFVFTQNAIGWDARSSENSQTASLFFLSCQGPVLRFEDTIGVIIRLLAGNPRFLLQSSKTTFCI